VAGPWQPSSINTSGTWNVDDIRADAARRATPPPQPAPGPEPGPPPLEDEMLYLATLIDATVVVGSSVRPVSTEEVQPGGPYANLPRYTPDPAGYWYAWLAGGAAEYSARVMGM
jgi:hypothetical protein